MELSVAEQEAPTLLHLPLGVLQEVFKHCSVKYGLSAITCCKSLWALEAQLLDLQHTSVTLTSPRQAKSLPAWVAKHKQRITQLAVTVAAQSDVQEAQDMEWVLRDLWQAMDGAAGLQTLVWDAAYLRSSSTEVVSSHSGWLGSKFYYEPPQLRSLQQLSIVADAVALPAAYSSLTSLTALSLGCMAVQLAPSCLPPSLRALAISLDGEQMTSMGIAVQLPAAAARAPQLARFELQWNSRRLLSLQSLSALTSLTALQLGPGRILSLPFVEELSQLAQLQELSLREMAVVQGDVGQHLVALPQLTQLHLVGVWGSADFSGIWSLPNLEDLCFIPVSPLHHVIPLMPRALRVLELDLYLALANQEALQAMTNLRQLALPCRAKPLRPAEVAALLGAVGGLPCLERLSVGPLEAAGCLGASEVEEALQELRMGGRLAVSLIRSFPVQLLWLDSGNGWG